MHPLHHNSNLDFVLIPFTKDLSLDEKKYLDKLTQDMDKMLKTTEDWLRTDEALDLFIKEREDIEEALNDSVLTYNLDVILNDVNFKDYDDFIERFYKIGSGLGHSEISRDGYLTLADKQSLYFLQRYNFHLVKDIKKELADGIRSTIGRAVLGGMDYKQTARLIRELPLTPIKSPMSLNTRCEMIARTEHARAVNVGTLQAYTNYNVQEVDIITAGDDLVCYICREIEDKNPIPLTQAEILLPAHPNCRCAWSAHINSDLDIPSEPVVNPKPIFTKQAKTFNDISTPEEVANYFGYDLTESQEKIMFRDKENKTSIYVPRELLGMNDCIKVSNKCQYQLKEIIQMYDEAPEIMKKATRGISFNNETNGFVLGYCTPLSHVVINGVSIRHNKTTRGNLRQTLYHEMFHALDFRVSNTSQMNNRRFALSSSSEFGLASDDDIDEQVSNGYDIEDASWYGSESSAENGAETASMVCCINAGHEESAIMQQQVSEYSYKDEPYEEWIKRHRNKSKVIENFLNTLTINDFDDIF